MNAGISAAAGVPDMWGCLCCCFVSDWTGGVSLSIKVNKHHEDWGLH
jgi:hypothetical protein